MWLYSDPPHPHSPLCWLLLSIYENCSKTELNFPPVHAFPHPCHPQLASAFGCSIELTDASQHGYLWANGVQNSRFLTEGVFIVLIPDLTDWNPCFQCGVWFPWRWSANSFRTKCSATDAASTQSLLWTPQNSPEMQRLLGSPSLLLSGAQYSSSEHISVNFQGVGGTALGFASGDVFLPEWLTSGKRLWSPGSLYQLCLGGINETAGWGGSF